MLTWLFNKSFQRHTLTAIKASDSDKVRDMLLKEKSLSSEKYRDPSARFEADVELDAYKFLGAYLGSLTPLQFAILLGHDSIARDIIERSFKDDLDDTFGVSVEYGQSARVDLNLISTIDIFDYAILTGYDKYRVEILHYISVN